MGGSGHIGSPFRILKGFGVRITAEGTPGAAMNARLKQASMEGGCSEARIGDMAREIFATGIGNAFLARRKSFS